jgi:cysteine synthase
VAASRGYGALFTMPESIAREKIDLMRTLGAEVILTPSVPFSDAQHYYWRARRIAAERPRHVFMNQFENLANSRAHYESTAPEIWTQCGGQVDAFVSAAGTGGTVAGCARYLTERRPEVRVFVVDPPGSGLFDRVVRGASHERADVVDGVPVTWIPRSEGSSLTEGIGIGRVTANFRTALPLVHGAFQVSDQEVLDMAYHVLRCDGLFVGPSAALNLCGALQAARQLGGGADKTVVTVVCDGGDRYRSKLYNPAWLAEHHLQVSAVDPFAARVHVSDAGEPRRSTRGGQLGAMD